MRLFEEIRTGNFEAYTSGYVIRELEATKAPKRENMLSLVKDYGVYALKITKESDQLADLYVAEGIIPARFRNDAAHIAISSISGLDCVLSYNFKHINRFKTKLLTAKINHARGYNNVMICTAKEVLDDDH
jgi:hypothetical protein